MRVDVLAIRANRQLPRPMGSGLYKCILEMQFCRPDPNNTYDAAPMGSGLHKCILEVFSMHARPAISQSHVLG